MKRIISLLCVIFLAMQYVYTAASENEETYFSIAEISAGATLKLNEPVYADGAITITGKYGDFAGRKVTLRAVTGAEDEICALGECETSYGGDFSISVHPDTAAWDQTITIYLCGTRDGDTAYIKGTIVGNEIDLYKNYADELNTLLAQCKTQGIPVDYEQVNVAVLEEFVELLKLDKETGNTERYEYNANALKEIYDDTKTALTEYLNGSRIAKSVPRYVTGAQSIEGKNMLAQVNDNGKIKTSPMYYLGYTYWGSPVEELVDFEKFGTNIVHMDIGPSQVIVKPSDIADWQVRADDPWANYNYAISSNTTYAKSGSRSAGMVAEGEGYMLLSQTVQAEPNTKYEFGADIKNIGADGVWMELGGKALGKNPRHYFNDVCDWTTQTKTYQTGADETEITLTLGVTYNSEGTYFDNAFVKKAGSQNNLLQNPGFETVCEITSDYVINYDYIEKLKGFLRQAEEYNISVILMLSNHYMPQFIYELDSTLKNTSPSYTTFMPYHPTHPLALQVLGDYLDALIPELAEFDCINSICLANEPRYYSNRNDYYLSAYREKLQKDFGTVSEYNKQFSTLSFSWNYVSMPKDSSNMKLYNYWREFNDSILTEWLTFMREKVKNHASGLPVHAKVMQYILPEGSGEGRVAGSNNYEKWTDIMDVNGNDGWAYFGEEEYPIQAKMAWYDYLGSVNEAPIINAEDHILQDGAEFLNNEGELDFNITDIWQGVMHGRTASALWTWWPNKLAYAKDSGFTNTLLNARADYVAAIGKTALDFQRLSSEITAINDAPRRVAILYSDNSLVGNQHYSSALYETYKAATYAGERVKFVTETKPEAMNDGEAEILILPCSNYLKESTISEISKFIESGKKVIQITCGESYYNENGKALTTEAANTLAGIDCSVGFETVNNTSVSDTDVAVKSAINEEIDKLECMVRLQASGDVEWSRAQHGGKYLINLCNYGDSDAQISITAQKGNICSIVDLISGNTLENSFVLNPNTPMLLQVDIETHKIEFYAKNDAQEYVPADKLSGRELLVKGESVNAKPGEELIGVVAVYKDDEMTQCVKEDYTADENGYVSFEIPLTIEPETILDDDCVVKAFLWTKEKLSPLGNAVSIKGGN